MDVKDEVVICYKLTDEHIYKEKLRKMKANVKWGQGKLLPKEALDTVDFVSFIDSLFDSFNGSALTATHGKLLRCAVHSPGSNCEEDENDGALTSLQHYINTPDVAKEGIQSLPNVADTDIFSVSAEDFLIKEKSYGPNKLLSPNTPYLKLFNQYIGAEVK
ncbi:hypothetical protein Trydic_g16988 [Trypoxylus dichotomus]